MFEISDLKFKPGMDSESLSTLAAAAKTDPAVFGRLYDHYVKPVYNYIRSRIATEQEAEDLTSKTFIAAYEALPRYHERGLFAAWLFRIARSKLTDHLRRSKYEVPLETVENWAGNEDTLEQLVRSEDLRRLASLIRCLSDGDRDLIQLRYVAGLSFAEMAEVLGKREDAVKKSLYRLLVNIKGQLE
jgi:RNA polymerase sigma-70 factor (ECF subfamily)